MTGTLTHYGYLLENTEKELERLQKYLIVIPKASKAKYPDGKPILCWSVDSTGSWLIVPRFYASWRELPIKKNKLSSGDKIANHKFAGNLKATQERLSQKVQEKLQESGGCLAVFPTGTGKTRIALSVYSSLGCKTLVLAPRIKILQGWLAEIKECFGDSLRAEIMKGKLGNLDEVDMALMTYASYSKVEAEPKVLRKFGMLILDEVHLVNSEEYSKCLSKWVFHYSLGLTATPERLDGAEKLSYYYVGREVIEVEGVMENHAQPKEVRRIGTEFWMETPLNEKGDVSWSAYQEAIAKDEDRNELIAQAVRDVLKKEPDRNVLILVNGIEHTEVLAGKLGGGYLHSGVSEATQEKVMREEKIIVATYSMCSVGVNIPRLDTLVMGTPRKAHSLKQIMGRILRKVHERKPLYLDIRDTKVGFLRKQTRERDEYYKSLGL